MNTVPIQVPPLRERGEDVVLLFRKFASDFAEKYRMPAIQLTEDGKQVLLGYSWPGNVRQLKNITEQISIIETNREINASILKGYLPEQNNMQRLPALFGVKEDKSLLYAGYSGGGTSGNIQCPHHYTSFGKAGYSGGR